jgi:hypothetical protein
MCSSTDRVKLKTAIGICCFSVCNAPLRKKSKDWLAQSQNQDYVSEWAVG